VDGSIRDTPQIGRLQFPVFSRGVAPSTTIGHYRFAGVNVPVTCAGVRVNAGDIITADEDGVAVVERAHAAEVLKKAQELDNTEHSMLPFIEKFRSLKEAVAKFAGFEGGRGGILPEGAKAWWTRLSATQSVKARGDHPHCRRHGATEVRLIGSVARGEARPIATSTCW